MAMSLPGTGSGLPASLQHPVSSRYPPPDRRHWSQQGIAMATASAGTGQARDQRHTAPAAARRSAVPGTPSGSAAAGDGQARPGPCRPSRAIEAQPHGHISPWYQIRTAGRPAAPGELAVPPADRRRRPQQGGWLHHRPGSARHQGEGTAARKAKAPHCGALADITLSSLE